MRGIIGLLSGALGATLAFSALAAPAPGSLETYRDWAIGCDNLGRCTAASLFPDNGDLPDSGMTLYLTRDAGPDAPPKVELHLGQEHNGPVELLVDGVAFATAQAKGNRADVPASMVAPLIKGMVRGLVLTATTGESPLGSASLTGASAALRYMDAEQGRAGTVTALVAHGALPASTVHAAGKMPVVYFQPAPKGLPQPTALWREERERALRFSGCAEEQHTAQDAQIARLSDKEELVLIPCGAGAYNFSSVPMIATGQAGRRIFTLARFDSPPGWTEKDDKAMLVNAGWDSENATLSSFAKGRGLGDCGSAQSYVWDGTLFRLIELQMMDQCRGAWNWITLWRAQPSPMPVKKK